MILETERLILRGWREDDAASLFKYAKDKRVGPMAGWLPHRDVSYSRAVIRTILSGKESYAICFKGSDEPIGSIALHFNRTEVNDGREKEAELGYWIGYPYWGFGIASEAAKEMVRHGFEDLGLELLYCGYFEGNERSRKVQEKTGFRYHHTNPKCQIKMLGETRVEYVNSMSYAEWMAVK